MRKPLLVLLLIGIGMTLSFWLVSCQQATAGFTTPQLIVEAVLSDDWRARQAQDRLRQFGHCPDLGESPETPVGLAGAAYGLPGSDRAQARRTIELLLQQGCAIDQYSAAGLTPLHGAIIGRQAELLELLLAAGADPHLRVVPIPGRALGRSIAHLDAYGVAQVVRQKHPDDPALARILERLQPRDAQLALGGAGDAP